jgi:hypothetical protein
MVIQIQCGMFNPTSLFVIVDIAWLLIGCQFMAIAPTTIQTKKMASIAHRLYVGNLALRTDVSDSIPSPVTSATIDYMNRNVICMAPFVDMVDYVK